MVGDVQNQELQRIEDKVRDLTLSALSNGRPLLLSALGIALGEDLKILKQYTGDGLSRFIQDRMSDQFGIVLGGEYRNVQAVVRAGVDGPIPSSSFEDQLHPRVSSPRYHFRSTYRRSILTMSTQWKIAWDGSAFLIT
jgi:hypothetical protein